MVEGVATALTGQAPKTNREILLDRRVGGVGTHAGYFPSSVPEADLIMGSNTASSESTPLTF